MVAVMWQFEIHAGKTVEFERLYGADGDWTKMSRRSRSFLGSSFLRDLAREDRYVLVEYWSEMVVYEQHVAAYKSAIGHLEKQRDSCVRRIDPLGVFTALDVPERVGPTWSRRSGKR
jgi:hypothetical protein